MTAENNKRYIPEAWIQGNDEKDFVKSFLMSIVQEIQGHRDNSDDGFNADKVDGWHKSDIEEAIEDAVENLLSEFSIGVTQFTAERNEYTYYLGFEAIKLYNEEEAYEDPNQTDYYRTLPWETDPRQSGNIPNLLETFKSFYDYNKTQISTINSALLIAQQELNNIKKALQGKIDKDGHLNADSVNGLRFFIYTQEQYEALKTRASQYDLNNTEGTKEFKNDYIKLHDVQNIFIIKSLKELQDSGYPDGVYTWNPDNAIIDKYYRFRVFDKPITDEETGEEYKEKWLQYSHENNGQWFDLCEAKKFLDKKTIEDYLIGILNTNTNYTLKPEAVKDALKYIRVDKNTDLPITNYNKNKYIIGGVYDVVKDENNEIISRTILGNETINDFQYINLTKLQNALNGNLNDFKTLIQGENGEGGKIGDIKTDLSSVKTDINLIKGGSDKSIKNIMDKLDTIEGKIDKIDEIQEKLTKYGKWKEATWEGGMTNYNGKVIYYNDDFQLVFFSIEFYIQKDTTSWTIVENIDRIPSCIRPRLTQIFPTSNPDVQIAVSSVNFNKDENLNYRFLYKSKGTGATSSKQVKVSATGIWYFDLTANKEAYDCSTWGTDFSLSN